MDSFSTPVRLFFCSGLLQSLNSARFGCLHTIHPGVNLVSFWMQVKPAKPQELAAGSAAAGRVRSQEGSISTV